MKRILVCLDGSARSPGVLATGLTIARAQGAKAFLLRSVGLPPDIPQDFWKTTSEPILDVLLREAKTYLEAQSTAISLALLGGIDVVVGTPWQSICDTARTEDVDLVVIGSHGYGGLDRLLGTTAAKVVNHAPCSVVVVRERESQLPAP